MNMDFMNQLIKFGAENLHEKIEQGLELLEANRLEGGYELFWEVLNDPDVELQHFLIVGDAYLKKKMWKEAQEVFTKAVEKDPESINLLNRMAISFRKDGKFDQALETYKKAIMLSRQDENLYYNVARLFLDMKKPVHAGKALEKALSLNPQFERASKLLDGIKASGKGAGGRA